MTVEWHAPEFYHKMKPEGDPMIGPLEFVVILFIAAVIYGYVRLTNRKKK